MAVTTQLNTAGTPIIVASGGTGVSTFTTANGVLCSNTTANGPVVTAVPSTSGFLLTSNGSSVAPSFQAPALKTISVTMTNTQFNGMFATPFEIIPSPGAGNVILPQSVAYMYVYGGTNAFTLGGTINLQWGTVVNGAGISCMNTVAASNFTGFSKSMTRASQTVSSALVKASFDGLSVCLSNLTQAFATGTNNTVIVIVSYLTVATGL